MSCHVALLRTYGSEELTTSIIRVERISELETTLAVTSKVICSSETSVLTRATLRHIAEGGHGHCSENFNSYIYQILWHHIQEEVIFTK
jgi:hypothetical protein